MTTSKHPRLFYFFLIALLASPSCSKRKLAKEDIMWNPYQVGNELVFVNDKGDQQTFFISEIETVKIRNNPYAGTLSGTRENQLTYIDTTKLSTTPKEHVFLAIGKDRERSTWISFVLNLPNVIDANHTVTIDELTKMTPRQMTVKNKLYKDVLELHPVNQGGTLAFPEIRKICWSKANGYVQYELSNGEVWSLK